MRLALTYQGYAARIEFSAEDECLAGYIAGIQGKVVFHGESVSEFEAAFEGTD